MKSDLRLWTILVSCFAITSGGNAYIIAPGSIGPVFAAAFDVSRTSIGLTITITVLGSIAAQLPVGILMDRYDNRNLLTAVVAVFMFVGAAGAFVESYEAFLATRLIAGAMAGVLVVIGANIVEHIFSPDRIGFATTLFVASGPFGIALAQFMSPLIAQEFGVVAVILVYPALSLIALVVFRTTTSGSLRAEGELKLRDLRSVFANRNVLLIAVSGFCTYAIWFFVNSWLPTFGTEQLSLSLAMAGALASVLPLVGIIARPSGGLISDYLGNRPRPVIAGSLFVMVLAFGLFYTADSIMTYLAGLILGGFALQLGTGLYYLQAQELAFEGSEATSLTVFSTIAFSGALFSPYVSGWLIENFSWQLAFQVFAVVAVVGGGAELLLNDT